MDLLETLGGSDDDFLYCERFIFCGDRDHALRSTMLMRQEGLIQIWFAGRIAEDWRIAAWRRSPRSAETVADLQRIKLALTDAGYWHYWHGGQQVK